MRFILGQSLAHGLDEDGVVRGDANAVRFLKINQNLCKLGRSFPKNQNLSKLDRLNHQNFNNNLNVVYFHQLVHAFALSKTIKNIPKLVKKYLFHHAHERLT